MQDKLLVSSLRSKIDFRSIMNIHYFKEGILGAVFLNVFPNQEPSQQFVMTHSFY